jgi:hypothetical protein
LLEGLCIWASTDITDQDMLKTSRFSRLVPPDNARNTYAYIYININTNHPVAGCKPPKKTYIQESKSWTHC